jgi:hypothetical protein
MHCPIKIAIENRNKKRVLVYSITNAVKKAIYFVKINCEFQTWKTNSVTEQSHRKQNQKQYYMKPTGKTVKDILVNLPEDRAEPFNKLHDVIVKNLPKGFEAAISYGGLGYVVPHTLYPAGYHCKPSEPLPFAGIASQKDSINFYHMGIYSDPELLKWFVTEYPKHSKQKLDMGKSCVRFKKLNEIPYKLIGELMKKMSAKEWIEKYEATLKPKPGPSKAKSKK